MTHRYHRHHRRYAGGVFTALALICVIAATKCGPAPTSSPTSTSPSTTSKPTATTPTTASTTTGTTTPTTTAGNPALPAIRTVHDPGTVTGTITGPCHLRGDSPTTWLPDPRCTPGAYDPTVTAAELCSGSYTTSSYRPPESDTEHAKWDQVEPAYGINEDGELDHLIPLELAGANDLANLWVEPGSIPNPKDSIENALHDWVCADPTQSRLRAAQTAIATDWTTAETKLGITP